MSETDKFWRIKNMQTILNAGDQYSKQFSSTSDVTIFLKPASTHDVELQIGDPLDDLSVDSNWGTTEVILEASGVHAKNIGLCNSARYRLKVDASSSHNAIAAVGINNPSNLKTVSVYN